MVAPSKKSATHRQLPNGGEGRSLKLKKVLLSVLVLLLAIKGSVSVNTFESVPPTSESGLLTTCVGERISLTCSHDNIGSGGTRWIASPPIDCTTDISHIGANPRLPDPCGPFKFQEITPQVPLPRIFNSSAIATATVNMTDTNIECRGGNNAASFSVGNISLCVADRPPPPSNLRCENITNGLNVSWETVNDTSCAMSDVDYLLTVIREHDMMVIVPSMTTVGSKAELTDTQVLQPETIYIISVRARILEGSCSSENATNTTCETSASLPTQPPLPQTESSQNPTSSSGPSTASLSTGAIAGITIVGVVIISVFMIVIVIIIVAVIKKSRDGKDGTDQGIHAPLANDTEQQQLPLYAMVDKSQKTVAEQPTYQDPSSIQHETAPTGDVYAVTDKQQKKKGPTEAELAQMYSVPDKTKGGVLNYASLDMPAGGSEAKMPAPIEYATVIN